MYNFLFGKIWLCHVNKDYEDIAVSLFITVVSN